MFRRLNSLSKLFGIDVGQGVAAASKMPKLIRDFREFKSHLSAKKVADFPFGKMYPCLHDDKDNSGTASGHYFHQDLLVASRIYQNAPARHVDVGSRIDGFVAHVACFREIEVFDIRPLESAVTNLVFRQVDLMGKLPDEFVGYTDSLSCLHALEHFGLGKYGDPIKPDGYLLGFRNLTAILRSGGTLYLSVPIGWQRIEFNAHRVFSVAFLLTMFEHDFDLVEFSYVNDQGDLSRNVELTSERAGNSFGCQYGCGIFELRKR